MHDRVFLDSNILIYAHTDLDCDKQKVAQGIICRSNSFVSTQVLQETANTLYKKFKRSWIDITKVLNSIKVGSSLYINTDATVLKACDLAGKYYFSFYDSLIVSSALEAKCLILYSEDLQHKQIINDSLIIKNPFL